jgi:hypothetical protein
MIKIPFNTRLKLFGLKGVKVFSLFICNENIRKAPQALVSFLFIPRVNSLFYCVFYFERQK